MAKRNAKPPPVLTLVIGDKNLSSWSMRPWLVLKLSGLEFREVKVLLDRPTTAKELRRYSPSGKVPVLSHGRNVIWDSLAICEYLAELAPEVDLWPKDQHLRALARSYTAEMHSGFQGLRSQLSMDICLRMQIKHLTDGTLQDIRRIQELWGSALKASGGSFLFGEFGIVDAFFAPVVMRFLSYDIRLSDPACRRYMKRVASFPAVSEWVAAAHQETPYRVKL